MSVLLEGIGLKKSYRQGAQTLEVLKGVDLSLQGGEIAAVQGSSGSGKSTLLHLLGGLDVPTAGEIRFSGRDLACLPDRQKAQLRNQAFGFVFQFYHLIPELTALENAALPVWMANGGDPKMAFQKSRRWLEAVGLAERLSHHPAQLSGGEQQRVCIARALVNDPQLVFCDEPTGSLDAATGAQILEVLVALNRSYRTTFLIVTHEPSVTRIAGRVLTLKDGQLWP